MSFSGLKTHARRLAKPMQKMLKRLRTLQPVFRKPSSTF